MTVDCAVARGALYLGSEYFEELGAWVVSARVSQCGVVGLAKHQDSRCCGERKIPNKCGHKVEEDARSWLSVRNSLQSQKWLRIVKSAQSWRINTCALGYVQQPSGYSSFGYRHSKRKTRAVITAKLVIFWGCGFKRPYLFFCIFGSRMVALSGRRRGEIAVSAANFAAATTAINLPCGAS